MTVNNSFKDKAKNFLPQESLINFKGIEAESEKRGRSVSTRTVRYYITEKILPKPMYVKKVAYFDKDFIFDELEAIHVLQTLFGMGINEIKNLSKNAFSTLKDIVSILHDILNNPVFISKHNKRPLGFRFVNSKIMQYTAKKFFEKVGKGYPSGKLNNDKFIDTVLEDYKKEFGDN